MFQRQHYEALAKLIREDIRFPGPDNGTETDFAVNKLVEFLGRDNPRFNRERFLKAAGVTND